MRVRVTDRWSRRFGQVGTCSSRSMNRPCWDIGVTFDDGKISRIAQWYLDVVNIKMPKGSKTL